MDVKGPRHGVKFTLRNFKGYPNLTLRNFKVVSILKIEKISRTCLTALTNRLIIVSMHFLFNGARVLQPAVLFLWRVRKPALRYLGTPFYFETISTTKVVKPWPVARRASSTRWASKTKSSSLTGRPWQALRTPTRTFSRLNGSVAPERLMMLSTATS